MEVAEEKLKEVELYNNKITLCVLHALEKTTLKGDHRQSLIDLCDNYISENTKGCEEFSFAYAFQDPNQAAICVGVHALLESHEFSKHEKNKPKLQRDLFEHIFYEKPEVFTTNPEKSSVLRTLFYEM